MEGLAVRITVALNRAGRKDWTRRSGGVLHAEWCHYAHRTERLRLYVLDVATVGAVRSWAERRDVDLCDYCIGTSFGPRAGRRFERSLRGLGPVPLEYARS
jgi:hypothetical protein